ncbi:MAG: DUF362 domain-containing protein [Deltaproteobacteria bacterium]
MSKSPVYFVPVTEKTLEARRAALARLLRACAPAFGYRRNEIVPVKVTVGDASCAYPMHPQLVKEIVGAAKEGGARPFLFDTSVIYHGRRQNAVDHLNLAEEKGFGAAAVGAPFVVADGVLGQDGTEQAVNGRHIRTIKAPSFVGYLESLLVVSHSTGHIFTGYAAAIKNVAMGMSCRPTKQVQHSSMKPRILEEKCTACGCCVKICPVTAIALPKKGKAVVDARVCVGCGECLCACQFDAVEVNWEEDTDVFHERMVDVARFLLAQFKRKFFITFAFDMTRDCDCMSTKDDPMVMPDLGFLASEDIVAVDQAAVDLIGANPYLDEHKAWRHMLDYAHETGLGSREYRLVRA